MEATRVKRPQTNTRPAPAAVQSAGPSKAATSPAGKAPLYAAEPAVRLSTPASKTSQASNTTPAKVSQEELAQGSQPPPVDTLWQRIGLFPQIEQFKRMYHEHRYGCWCGPGHVCKHVQDDIDDACRTHDLKYDVLHVSGDDSIKPGWISMWSIDGFRKTVNADREFVANLKKTIFDRHLYGPAAAMYRGAAILLFSGRARIGDWLIAHNIQSSSVVVTHLKSAPGTTPSPTTLGSEVFISDISIFDAKVFNKELFNKSIADMPIAAFAVGPAILRAFINGFASSNVSATVGPGMLRDIKLALSPFAGKYTGTAQLFIPFGGGVALNLDGTIGGQANILGFVSAITLAGGLKVNGIAELPSYYTLTPEITYDNGSISFNARTRLNTCLQLMFNLDAFVNGHLLPEKVSSWLSSNWSKRWSLANRVWQYCYELGTLISLGFVNSQPSLSLDFTAQPIPFNTLISDLLKNASGPMNLTPSTSAPATTSATKTGPSPQAGPATVAADDAKKKRPPFVLKLPQQKAPHLATYRAWLKVLQSDPNYERGNPAQRSKWNNALRLGGSHSIPYSVYKRGHSLGFTGESGEQLIRIPNWSRTTKSIPMEVDHIVELQVTPNSLRSVFNDIDYYELLDQSSNGASGSLLANNIAAERKKQVDFDPSVKNRILPFDEVTLDGGTAGERWRLKGIQDGKQLDAFEKHYK